MENEIDNGFEKLSPNDEDIVSSSNGVANTEGSSGVEDVAVSPKAVAEDKPVSQPLKASSETANNPQSSTNASQPASCVLGKGSEGSSCCVLKSIDPRVIDLLLWRDIKMTAVVLSSTLIVMLSLLMFSVVSVVAYFGLVVLTITTSFRLYCNVMSMMNKSTDSVAPFKKYLDCSLTIPEDTVRHLSDTLANHVNGSADHLRRLFLVENVVDSLKFGLILWLFTYVGSWFNGLTLVLLATVGVFTLPKVYVTYQVHIDHYTHLVSVQACEAWKKIEQKIPMLAKKKQA